MRNDILELQARQEGRYIFLSIICKKDFLVSRIGIDLPDRTRFFVKKDDANFIGIKNNMVHMVWRIPYAPYFFVSIHGSGENGRELEIYRRVDVRFPVHAKFLMQQGHASPRNGQDFADHILDTNFSIQISLVKDDGDDIEDLRMQLLNMKIYIFRADGTHIVRSLHVLSRQILRDIMAFRDAMNDVIRKWQEQSPRGKLRDEEIIRAVRHPQRGLRHLTDEGILALTDILYQVREEKDWKLVSLSPSKRREAEVWWKRMVPFLMARKIDATKLKEYGLLPAGKNIGLYGLWLNEGDRLRFSKQPSPEKWHVDVEVEGMGQCPVDVFEMEIFQGEMRWAAHLHADIRGVYPNLTVPPQV